MYKEVKKEHLTPDTTQLIDNNHQLSSLFVCKWYHFDKCLFTKNVNKMPVEKRRNFLCVNFF